MKITIRRAEIYDAKDLAHIILESWRSTYSDLIPEEEIKRYLDLERRRNQFERFISQGEIVLIGFIDNKPCGLAFANPDNDEGLEVCGSIYSMYTLEESWGMGLGKALMDNVIRELREAGCRKVLLWVYEENPRARKFYEKCGFSYDGKSKESHFSNSPLELRYIKDL